MKNTRAALRYAKAALSTSLEQKKEETLGKDMQQIADVFAENGMLTSYLDNPVIPNADKLVTLQKVFVELDALSNQLLALLATNNRINILDQVALSFLSLLQKHQGKETALVTTATPLTPELEKLVLTKANELSSANIQIENTIDASIIGGFILRIGDLQYNASVAHQLDQLKYIDFNLKDAL